MGGNPSVWLVLRAELSREVLRDEVPARGMTHADGGVYAKVQAVEHLSPNGKVVPSTSVAANHRKTDRKGRLTVHSGRSAGHSDCELGQPCPLPACTCSIVYDGANPPSSGSPKSPNCVTLS